MKIHKLLKIGSNHKTHCEDFLSETSVDKKYKLFAVLDGCSSGEDSFFASAFIGKLLRKQAGNYAISEGELKTDILKNLIFGTAKDLRKAVRKFNLSDNELLATLIVLLVDEVDFSFAIAVIGDGFVSIDGKQTIFDQNNQPDYLAYHLKNIKKRKQFEAWFPKHVKTMEGKNFKDLTISTDGIESFTNFGSSDLPIDVIDYMTNDNFLQNNPAMLARKCNILKKKYTLENQDDLGIIRLQV